MILNMSDKDIVYNTHNSKGNQLKWKVDNNWYKADYLGYESLSECICSKLLEYTNISDFVKYDLQKINYKGQNFNGCVSENFLEEDYQIVTLDKLFLIYYNIDISEECAKYYEVEDKIKFVVDKVIEATGLEKFGQYLTLLLEIDFLFLNEDRHFNNIAVLQNINDESFDYCPIFDNGAALFSDTLLDYPLDLSLEECFQKIEAKPFSRNFEEQVDAAEHLYKTQLKYNFTMTNVKSIIFGLKDEQLYSDKIYERIILSLREQLKINSYYQCSNYMNLPKLDFQENLQNNIEK